MGRRLNRLLISGVIVLLLAASLRAETRTALVIGNGDYLKSPLNNPVNDAKDMAAVLADCGFEVILKTNRDKSGMLAAVNQFGQRLKRGGTGLFFYAGHGVQVNGVNYMIPVGARVSKLADIRSQCLEISSVLSAMQTAKNDLNIVILDACRNNPFEKITGVSKGLALMDAPKGSYIAFSTRPGALSGDGYRRNGLYTSKLLKHIRTPGLSLVDLFMTVRNEVIAASGDTQEPWDNHALRRHFYFVPKGTESSPPYAAGVVAANTPVKGYRDDRTDMQVFLPEAAEEIPEPAGDTEWLEAEGDEPDAPDGFRKEVVVEYHYGEPVEVVYYVPDEDDILYDDMPAVDEDDALYDETDEELWEPAEYDAYEDGVTVYYPDDPPPPQPVVAQRRIEPPPRAKPPKPRPRFDGPPRVRKPSHHKPPRRR